MSRNYGISSRYDYRRSDFQMARTQREAGIDHLPWETDQPQLKRVFIVLCLAFVTLGALIAWLT